MLEKKTWDDIPTEEVIPEMYRKIVWGGKVDDCQNGI